MNEEPTPIEIQKETEVWSNREILPSEETDVED